MSISLKSSIKSTLKDMKYDNEIPLTESEIKLVSNLHIQLLNLQDKILSGSELSIDDTFNLFTNTISNRFNKSTKLKLKNSDIPKKPLTPYMYFANDIRDSIKQKLISQNIKFNAIDISKNIAAVWKSELYRNYNPNGNHIDPSNNERFDYTDLCLKYFKMRDEDEKIYYSHFPDQTKNSFKMPITLFIQDPINNHLIEKFRQEYISKNPSSSINSTSCKSYIKSSMNSLYITQSDNIKNYYKDLSKKSKLN